MPQATAVYPSGSYPRQAGPVHYPGQHAPPPVGFQQQQGYGMPQVPGYTAPPNPAYPAPPPQSAMYPGQAQAPPGSGKLKL